MFSTHTLVTYPIVSRLGIVRSEAVAITVGGTILTDTAVLLLLAVITGSATGGLTHEFWVRLGVSLSVFLVVVVFIVPRLSAWFFKKLEGEKNSHFIFVLSMVLVSLVVFVSLLFPQEAKSKLPDRSTEENKFNLFM